MYLLQLTPKTSRKAPRSCGFTLVELMVVIGIIALLAAILLPTANWAIKAAKRTKALNIANQIQTGAMAYFTEYGVYPVPTAQTTDLLIGDTTAADGANWAILDCVLCGNIHPSDGTSYTAPAAGPLNARGIAFLGLKSSDVFTATDVAGNVNGVKDAPKNPLPSSNSSALFYNIAFDSDYSGVLGNPAQAGPPAIAASAVNGKMPNLAVPDATSGTSTAGVAVWANCNGNTTTNYKYWISTF